MDLKKKLKRLLFEKKPRYFSKKFIGEELYCQLMEKTAFLKIESSISERIYYVIHDLEDLIICESCKNPFQPVFRDFEKSFEKFLSQTCSISCKGIRETKNRFIPTENEKNKCITLYGSIDGWTNSQICHVAQKYDKKVVCKYSECDKVPRYRGNGIFHDFCSDKCRALHYKGKTVNPFSKKEVKEKIRHTLMTKYGVCYAGQLEKSRQATKNKWRDRMKKLEEHLLVSLVKENTNEYHDWKCNLCQTIFRAKWYASTQSPLCPECSKDSSFLEIKIEEYLKNRNLEFSKKRRDIISPYEIDVYVDCKKIGIECHGLYHHSEKFYGKDKHYIKAELADKNNIQLIQIFEDEIRYKWSIIESRLDNILGITRNKIYARKCMIKRVDSTESSKFLNENHIQGTCASTIRYGLYYDNYLVSLMCFSKMRLGLGNKKSGFDFEMTRFCNKKDLSIIGGASRLLHYFMNNEGHNKSILTYADRRWSTGKVYQTLGFKLIRISKPNYWVVKGNRRWHRFNFAKQFLKKKFGNYDSNKTERQMLEENNFLRLWDAGTKVYLYK